MGDFLVNDVLGGLVKAVAATLEMLWGLLAGTAFTTPDVTVLPQVKGLSGRMLAIVNVSFVLAILATGVMVMGRETVQSRYGLAELGPRLVIGWIAANFATPICGWLIGFANSFTAAVTGAGIRPQEDLLQLSAVLTASLSNVSDAFLTAIISVLLTVLTGMLLATWVVRTGALIVVVGVAPVALACHATPFTDGVARLWWRSFTVLLATVTLQALALHVTLTVFLDPKANLPASMPGDPTGNGTVNLLVIVCLLWAMLRIPGMLRRNLGGGGRQQNVLGVVLRMAVVQQVTRVLRLPLRALGGGAAARRAPGGASGAGGGPGVTTAVLPYWRPRAPRPLTAVPTAATTGAGSGPQPGRGSGAGPSPRPAAAPRTPPRPRPPLPAGVNPATAMPRQRPAWQTRTTRRHTPRRQP